MNHPFAIDAARGVLSARRLYGSGDPDAKVVRLYRLLYGRPPDADEAAMAREFLADRPVGIGPLARAGPGAVDGQ